MSPADLADLEALVALMDREGDHRAWMRLNDRFHDTLYLPSGKEFVCLTIRQLRQHVERYFWASGRTVRRNREADAEHRRILEACRAGHVTQAQKELEMHLSGTLTILTNTLRVARREDA